MGFGTGHIKTLGFWVFVLLISGFLAVAYFGTYEEASFNNESTAVFNDGWSYHAPDGAVQSVTLPVLLSARPDEPVVISRVLPEGMPSPVVLCFRASQQSVRVLLEGETIYSFGQDDSKRPFGRSPGSMWHMVRLPFGSENKEVMIELRSPYRAYAGMVNEIRIGSKAAMLFYIVSNYLPALIVTFFIFLVGAVMILLYLVLLRKGEASRAALHLGGFAVLIACWMFGETRLVQFMMANQFLALCITFVSLMLFPIPLLKFVGCTKNFHYRRLFGGMVGLLYLQTLVVCGLQLLNVLDFVEMMPVIHAVLLAVTIVSISAILLDGLYYHNRSAIPAIFSMLILSFFGILEATWLYCSRGQNTGGFMRIGVWVFLLVEAGLVLQRSLQVIRLSRVAELDLLTGCKNRTSYIHKLAELEGKRGISIVMADLNDLKTINDTLGHEQGDHALVCCARCFTQIFGSSGECYRIGGDEFVFLGSGLDTGLLEERAAAFEQLCAQESKLAAYPLCVAVGCAYFDGKQYENLLDAIHCADGAMYKRKHQLKMEKGTL